MKQRASILAAISLAVGLTMASPAFAAESSNNNTTVTGWYQDGNDWYYADENGAILTGFITDNDSRYFLDLSTGKMHTGWLDTNGTWYYFDPKTGVMQTGWLKDKNGTYYYFNEDGTMASNTWIGEYWLRADGSWDPKQTGGVHSKELSASGLSHQKNGWVCKNQNGQLVRNDWRFLNGNWYYFGDNAYAVKGWQYIGAYKYYFNEETYALVQNLDGILPIQPSYQITVDRTRCQVTVYAPDGDNGYIIPCRTFLCSPGKNTTPTPAGTFSTTNKYRWHTLMGPSYGQYCTRIGGMGILFHSIPGNSRNIYNVSPSKFNKLGEPASSGCIRMTVADAKWIYDNCALGTIVTIGDSLPAPFDKPAGIKIPEGQNWDPTDPAI